MANSLPLPVIRAFDNVTVVDDSKVGTKFRIAVAMVENSLTDNFCFASSPFGASPIALAEACKILDRKLNLFYPQVDIYTEKMQRAEALGAKITIVPSEDFAYAAAVAQVEAERTSGKFISFDGPEAVRVIGQTASSLNQDPNIVVAAAGLGGITKGLQIAWVRAKHLAVAVIDLPQADYGTAELFRTRTPFEEPATEHPPFECNPHFEAKAWPFAKALAQKHEGVLFWNPAAK